MTCLEKPLLFTPTYKSYVWGGQQLFTRYGRSDAPAVCAESWEISAHPDGESVICAGAFKGRGLADLTAEFGHALIGTKAPDQSRFPLLIKLIDARDRLSVQVHPNNANAHLTGGEPKTEMWVVLDRTAGACLYAGLANGVTPHSLRDALADGTAVSQLICLPVESGQALFIPGGLVHAIGAGCLIYEVQQSSNTTYRLFDWNRTAVDGNPRALHLEESLKTIDWSLPIPQMVTPITRHPMPLNRWSELVACAFFTMRRLDAIVTEHVYLDGTTFHALFVSEGQVTVTAGGASITLEKGSSALVPASATGYTLNPETIATVLVTTL